MPDITGELECIAISLHGCLIGRVKINLGVILFSLLYTFLRAYNVCSQLVCGTQIPTIQLCTLTAYY
jgi:hypothetical protein